MLLSPSIRCIFIAGLKVGSTSTQERLSRFFEICLSETQYGKHMSYIEIKKNFKWLFKLGPIRNYFVFGTIRDPVDWCISLYNSHCDDKFSNNPELYTRNTTFDEFLSDWRERNLWAFAPQYSRFVSQNGRLGLNYIIKYDNLDAGLLYVCRRIGIPEPDVLHANVSPRVLSRAMLRSDMIDRIYHEFGPDYELYQNFTGRILVARDRRYQPAGDRLIARQSG
jgi:hypothetical protein